MIPIPASVAEFYAEVGDGMVFRWRCKGDDYAPSAKVEFSTLANKTVASLDEIKWRTEWDDTYDFRFTKDPRKARRTAPKMRKWLPFHEEGNGDWISLDTEAKGVPVVYDRHDWFDGGTGENGHRAGASLLDFYTQWSKACFQFPRSSWWPKVFKASGGIDWASEEFREPFRLPTDGD
jgi:hypothetical protein